MTGDVLTRVMVSRPLRKSRPLVGDVQRGVVTVGPPCGEAFVDELVDDVLQVVFRDAARDAVDAQARRGGLG